MYQAAWGISGMFAGFILGAMGADFFPRLTAASNDRERVRQLVNEQTEIGILMALPGLIGTLAFAPMMMHFFYSAEFRSGADLLPFMILGVFGRVVSWPMGYILMAKGETRWFILSELASSLVLLTCTHFFLDRYGLVGASYAFAIQYVVYTVGIFGLGWKVSRFLWSRRTVRLLFLSSVLIGFGFYARGIASELHSLVAGVAVTLLTGFFSARGIVRRLGENHRLTRAFLKVPGTRLLCGFAE